MELKKRREFILRDKLLSIRDIVRVMDPEQNLVGNFVRKILSIRALFRLRDIDEKPVMVIRQKLASVRGTFKFFESDENGDPDESKFLGKMKRKLVSIKPKYWFENPLEERIFNIKGNIMGLKYSIIKDGSEIARISKKFWRVRDTYGLKINKELNDQMAMIILCTVMVLQYEIERIREQRRQQTFGH
ncbi:MAG: LURP-one-related/scramblase family protein [Promethearchaeota archaeon]